MPGPPVADELIELRAEQKRHGKEPQRHQRHPDDRQAALIGVPGPGRRDEHAVTPTEARDQRHGQHGARKNRDARPSLSRDAHAVDPRNHRNSKDHPGCRTHRNAGDRATKARDRDRLSGQPFEPAEPNRQEAPFSHQDEWGYRKYCS